MSCFSAASSVEDEDEEEEIDGADDDDDDDDASVPLALMILWAVAENEETCVDVWVYGRRVSG